MKRNIHKLEKLRRLNFHATYFVILFAEYLNSITLVHVHFIYNDNYIRFFLQNKSVWERLNFHGISGESK